MRHVPVLPTEVIESLQLKSGMNIADCTLGDGGHSEQILEKTSPNGRVLGIDADSESLLRAKNYLHRFEDRAVFVRDNFENIAEIIAEQSFAPVDGILIDLGWSSPQFEERGRGFSFLHPSEPLDMRYDAKDTSYNQQDTRKTASDLLNTESEVEIARMLKEYGEEKLYQEIAKAIIEERKKKAIETVGDLVEIVLVAYRKKLKTNKEIPWIGGLHPATKTFQALRIAVNDELGVLERVLPQAVEVLAPGGRLAVISFHSLEDRIVKHFFKSISEKIITVITKKPIVCSDQEAKENPRAASAKLRVIQKI